jgi:16S rRNA (uracil1498-N3)-methyltransferase
MSTRRFYCDDLSGDAVRLDDEQARHARKVLRLEAGDRVELLDGQGRIAEGVVAEIGGGSGVSIRITDRREAPRSSPAIDLAVAIPKGDRAAVLVEKASELGADRLIPLVTERSVVDPGAGKVQRFGRIATESCKQCGRAWVMQVTEPIAIDRLIAEADHEMKLIADTGLDAGAADAGADPDLREALRSGLSGGGVQDLPNAIGGGGRVIVLIGPEGGWTDQERNAAVSAGFRPWRIGPHVLRVETAALAALAILRRRS